MVPSQPQVTPVAQQVCQLLVVVAVEVCEDPSRVRQHVPHRHLPRRPLEGPLGPRRLLHLRLAQRTCGKEEQICLISACLVYCQYTTGNSTKMR